MDRPKIFGFLVPLMLAWPSGVSAHGLEILSGNALPVRAGGDTAVYLTISNEAFHAERLIGAASEIANKVELHADRDGRMVPVNGIEIPLNDRIDMRQTGHHIMLIGTKSDLTVGSVLRLRLQFGKNRFQNVMVRVGKGGAPAAASPAPQGGGHGK